MEAVRALRELKVTSKALHLQGDVTGFRRVDNCVRVLSLELEGLVAEQARLLEQITAGRAEERKLQDEIVELRNQLEDGDEAADIKDFPPEYFESME